ncbi:MAG: efflux RND transporter periplasmic adaptor subunit [Anaerolineae bacterium]
MKRIVTIVAAVVLLGVIGFLGYRRLNGPSSAAAADLQTVTVERGSLVATVNAAGNIAAKAETALTFRTTGKVTAVHVQKGRQVEAGQVLMELDTTDLELEVAKARLSLATAEAQLAKTNAGPTAAELAAAQASLESARENLAKVEAGPTQAQLAAAEAALKAAQDSYQRAVGRPTADDVEQARLKLDQAKNSLWASQNQRDATCGQSNSSAQCDSARAQVANAEISVRLAEATYQDAQTPATAAEIENAAAQVQRAQDDLDRLRNSPTAAELAAAKSQVAQAESQLEKLTNGPTAEDLAISEAQVEQARLSLQQAERRLEDAKLIAPFAGTVVTVNYREGEYVSASMPAVAVTDLSILEIEVPLAEMDVARVTSGQEVEIVLDALPGVTLQGHVSYVAPVASISQGVVNYPVTVEIEEPDPAVRPGMTAGVSIVVERREDVLTVPNRAVRSAGRQRVVEVLYQEQVIQAPVTLGMSNDTLTEVISGLKEGDQVVLRGATTTQVTPRGPGAGFFGGGGRR